MEPQFGQVVGPGTGAKALVKDQLVNVSDVCRSRLRSARTTAQILHRQLHSFGEDKEAEQKVLYQKLIETTEQMVRQARRVSSVLSQQSGRQAQRLFKEVQQVLPLVQRVITQTRSRVLQGKKVASDEKVPEGLRAAHPSYPTPQRRGVGGIWSPGDPG